VTGKMKRIWVSILGNMIEALCVACNENLHIDGFYCWGCGIDAHYSDMLDSELTLDWNE
jgi:hypothetical protein